MYLKILLRVIKQLERIALKKEDILKEIEKLENTIKQCKSQRQHLQERLNEVIRQEEERKRYISSKEILDLIYEQTGKKSNMSTIKRWADEGHLGQVVLEKDKFWAIRSKQGRKRFLYPKKEVFSFLQSKGLLQPKFDILDRVHMHNRPNREKGVIVDAYFGEHQFCYTVQLEKSRQVVHHVRENDLLRIRQESDKCNENEHKDA